MSLTLHPTSPPSADDASVGLQRDSAVPNHVVAQGIIANGPLLCMGAVMTSAAIYARGAMPLAYLLGAVLVWLWVNTPLQYSRKLASSGGMFYFVTKSTSPLVGFVTGLSYAIYYSAFAAAGAVYFSVMVQSLLQQFGASTGPGWVWVVLPVAVLAVPIGLVYRGIRPSLRYGLVTGLIELVLMVGTALAVVFLAGHANTGRVFEPSLAHNGFAGVGIGMLLADFSMSGSTATVYLGHEAKLPHRSIRRGLVLSTSAVVVVFMLVSYAMTVGWGPTKMAAFANSNIPGLLVIHHFLGSAVEILVAIFMANSIMSAIVASTLVVSRVSYAMGEAGLLPGALAKVNPRSGSPKVAVVATFAAAALGALLTGAIGGIDTAFTVLILIGTMGEFVGHILGNAALPAFARRRRITKPVVHVILPLASLVTTLLGIYYTFYPVSFPTAWGPVVLLGGLALGAVYYLTRRRPTTSADRAAQRARIDATGFDADHLPEGGQPEPAVAPAAS
ncbi:APC family permease [Aciditerrimonas ferrireducens]|uniref:APC family permease n=1 Tax=Aciditerrimonas ferrireducens TaxID=667306 RepID=A0ABV6C0Q5_9ACTN